MKSPAKPNKSDKQVKNGERDKADLGALVELQKVNDAGERNIGQQVVNPMEKTVHFYITNAFDFDLCCWTNQQSITTELPGNIWSILRICHLDASKAIVVLCCYLWFFSLYENTQNGVTKGEK